MDCQLLEGWDSFLSFYLFTKEREKIHNKRQGRVRLGAFIPQRKDRCAHCPALGSYCRVSAKPQPRVPSHNGRQLPRAWDLDPDMEQVCVASTGSNSDRIFFFGHSMRAYRQGLL